MSDNEISHAMGYTGRLNADAPEGTPDLPLTSTGGLSTWTGRDPAETQDAPTSEVPPQFTPQDDDDTGA